VALRQRARATLEPPGGLDHIPALGGQVGERPVGFDRVGIQLDRPPVAGLGDVEPLEEAQDVRASHVERRIVGMLAKPSLVVPKPFLGMHAAAVLKARGDHGDRRPGRLVPGHRLTQHPEALGEDVGATSGRQRVLVPSAASSALDPVVDEGIGAGISRIQVDALDLVFVRAAARPALEGERERARARPLAGSSREQSPKPLEG
jgi:hypothetical protein